MIISGGVNIYPQETEDVLLQHPAVADVAVFGVPNEEFGEEVKAVVQLQAGTAASEELKRSLIDYCREPAVRAQVPEERGLRRHPAANRDRKTDEIRNPQPLPGGAGVKGGILYPG